MAKDFARSDRVAEQMRRELADLLQFEVKDPRVGMVTVTEVEVTGDMAHAKIYYSTAEQDAKSAAELQKGLEKTAGFLRSQLSKRMLLRTVPQLHFVYDASIDNGMKLTRLINQALADSPKE
ncbi:30S ribosome-binding factor RbfA [Candidatus Methylopumilus turicensis]|jgi:ribosome-binding factor A|uniref:Ribosome-binding factor A n=1 Tax=Candidatus Methylopumilus turicensis TaxID=1581680 RepID=A0A0B7IRZ3_9PROT|nr:30S ribosome-binding factor RbfA [Candidatus Methylopumilus turicensis]CEN55109.1 30s ribosome binding factor [Candidatus Methylopumilus turicensis]